MRTRICTLILGFWGPRAATGLVRPSAHVRRGGACERGHRESDGGSLKPAVLLWCLASRRGVRPALVGKPGPVGTSGVSGKMAASRPCRRELKMEDAAPGRAGG